MNADGPGPIFTPFHQHRIAASGETVEQYNAKAAQSTMLKRPGRAEETADSEAEPPSQIHRQISPQARHFPLETRALAIAVFYAAGTPIGGIAAPWLFGTLIGPGSRWNVFLGYRGAALLMLLAAVMVHRFGVDAEGRSLEQNRRSPVWLTRYAGRRRGLVHQAQVGADR